MTPRRILYVIDSLKIGGTQRHLVQIASSLDRRVWQPEIYCLVERGRMADALEARGVPVRVSRFGARARSGRASILARGLRLLAVTGASMIEMMRRRPAIVHFFLPANYVVGGIAALATGRRNLVMSRRSLNAYQAERPLLARLERLLHPFMARISGNSRAVMGELAAEGVPAEKLRLIYNGIETAPVATAAQRAEARRALGVPADAFVMLLVANIIPYKGHADLLDALGAIEGRLPKPWLLLCAGRDDGAGASLAARAARLGIAENLRWLGLVSDTAPLYVAADLALLVSHEEGFSNAILEAMAAALPVIATNVGGNPEAVADGATGLLVPPRDPAKLGAAIASLAGDRGSAARMGQAGRARVEAEFSLAACVGAYDALYRELVDARDT
ncbi:MAG TPA: glycosyltransferase [Alphaproteobacteria bacterium]|nr:glycosyltransferase [Alphaproteobacteria bacterium]